MVKRFLSLLMILATAISFVICGGNLYEVRALNAEETSDEKPASTITDEELIKLLESADPADKPAFCDSFAALTWGSPLEDLPESRFTEVVVRGVEFAGYYGSAHYYFDAQDRLARGIYNFNETLSLEWIEALKIYLSIKNDIISEYGLPSETKRSDGPSTIEELISKGGGAWGEVWRDLTSSDGDKITLFAFLQGNGKIEIQFVNASIKPE